MDNTTPTVQPTLSQLLPMAASDQFKSFTGHFDNARNDTVQTMKILQTFWALAQNEGARLVSAEQRLNSCTAASEEMLGQTDALVNRLLENGLFEFNLPPALWVDPNSQQYQDTYNDLATQYRAADEKFGSRTLISDRQLKAIEAQIKSGGAVPFAAKPGPKRQMIAGPATPGLRLYIEVTTRPNLSRPPIRYSCEVQFTPDLCACKEITDLRDDRSDSQDHVQDASSWIRISTRNLLAPLGPQQSTRASHLPSDTSKSLPSLIPQDLLQRTTPVMLLKSIEDLGFLKADPESGLFLLFPVATRGIIAQQVTEHLLSENCGKQIVERQTHVQLIMECVGGAFTLPMEHSAIIRNATELYRKWLIDPKLRPVPVADNLSDITKFSMLFAPRDSGHDVHGELCINVLSVILKTVHGDQVNGEVWEELLRIMLGIADSLLKFRKEPTPVGDRIASLVLQALFELWLRSATRSEALWSDFKRLFMTWRHRTPVVTQWNMTIDGITARVIRLLYGSPHGSDSVVIRVDGSITRVSLPDEHVFYAWHRVIDMIGDIQTIESSQNYHEAIRGIAGLMKDLLGVQTVAPGPAPPSGNTILSVVGPFLLRAVNVHKTDTTFDSGIAEAIKALIQLFSSRHEFTGLYLASFYRGISMALRRGNYLMDVILTHCVDFFQLELPGSHVLMPDFLKAIRTVLETKTMEEKRPAAISAADPEMKPSNSLADNRRKHKNDAPPETRKIGEEVHEVPKVTGNRLLPGIISNMSVLRRSCIRLLGNFIALSSFYSTAPFHGAEDSQLATYRDVSVVIENGLLRLAIRNEDNPQNLQILLWMACSYLYENASAENPFGSLVLKDLLSYVADRSWAEPETLTAIKVIGELSHLIDRMYKEQKPVIVSVLETLCRLIEIQYSSGRRSEDLVVATLQSITKWVIADQSVYREEKVFRRLLQCIMISITERRGSEDISDINQSGTTVNRPLRTISIARHLLYILLERVDMTSAQLNHRICERDEQTLTNEVGTERRNMKVLSWDSNIMTFVNDPRIESLSSPTLFTIIRNQWGKSLWKLSLRYTRPDQLVYREHNGPSVRFAPQPRPAEAEKPEAADPKREIVELTDLLAAAERRKQEMILRKSQERQVMEVQHLESSNYGLEPDIHARRPSPLKAGVISPTQLFLSHFGFLGLSNVWRINAMEPFKTDSSPQFDLAHLKKLDGTPEKDCFSVSVAYLNRESDDPVIALLSDTSEDFRYTVERLGRMVKLSDHRGYVGGLEGRQFGDYAPYFSDFDTEVIYYVAPLMERYRREVESGTNKNNLIEHAEVGGKEKESSRKALIHSTSVLIAWCEDSKTPALRACKNELVIMVHPMRSGLFTIKLLGPAAGAALGPLVSDLIVSRAKLPTLLRRTAINAARLFADGKMRPWMIRRAGIDGIITSNCVEEPLHHFLPMVLKNNAAQ
ncbi:rap/ran GTPase-activating protein [Planoprotostelium fungivorum]|uniref:Rap/ran GTPase-activating protein n=1 Tax=Planoprotostelium fungivorum TaxID=1890364 RepID=A0A2P6NG69_9EUKA|nr:rap/ran GTPase-activating protein [Planoprotostelium fungivorum]